MADKNKIEKESLCNIKKYSGAVLPSNYQNFVIARWLRSFRYGNDYIKLVDSDSYYEAYGRYVRNVLEQQSTIVRLAVLEDNPDVAFGFSVSAGKVLHYVYVGLDYRNQGIGKHLVPIEVSEFTHLTKTGLKLWTSHAPKAKFNPFR